MTLGRDDVISGIPQELAAFGALVGGLSGEQLDTATRCEGWSVRDVAGHVIGTVVDVTEGRLEGQGTPEVTERQAQERKDRSSAELAAELDAALPALQGLLDGIPQEMWDGPSLTGGPGTLGFGVEAMWYDTYLHAEDIRAALGLPSERGAGLRCAAHHLTGYFEQQGFGPVTLELDGLEPIEVGGGGEVMKGDPMDFVLAATGRVDAAAVGFDGVPNVYAES